MTVDQLLKIYMPKRRALLQRGVRLEGWTVFIHPEDAMDIELERKGPIGGDFVYGATWMIDPEMIRGNLRIEIKNERTDAVSGC